MKPTPFTYRNIQKASVDWLQSYNFNIAGNLNFLHKVPMEERERLCSMFLNKLDRSLYPQASNSKNQKRIPRAVWFHSGANGDNPHIHFLMYFPAVNEIKLMQFCTLLEMLRTELNTNTARIQQNEIIPVRDLEAAAVYAGHEDFHEQVNTDGTHYFGHSLDSMAVKYSYLPEPDASGKGLCPPIRKNPIKKLSRTLMRNDTSPTHTSTRHTQALKSHCDKVEKAAKRDEINAKKRELTARQADWKTDCKQYDATAKDSALTTKISGSYAVDLCESLTTRRQIIQVPNGIQDTRPGLTEPETVGATRQAAR